MSDKLHPLWAVALTDELTLLRLKYGRQLSEAVRKGTSIADIRMDLPRPKDLILHILQDAFSVEIKGDNPSDQLWLGALAHILRDADWVISNDYAALSMKRIISQLRHGTAALLPGRHWLIRRYRSPILVHRKDQRFVEGFQAFLDEVGARVEEGGFIALDAATFRQLSMHAIAGTLSAEEAHRYYMDRR